MHIHLSDQPKPTPQPLENNLDDIKYIRNYTRYLHLTLYLKPRQINAANNNYDNNNACVNRSLPFFFVTDRNQFVLDLTFVLTEKGTGLSRSFSCLVGFFGGNCCNY